MACGDDFFDDIDEKLFNEISKNEELMKALGPLNPNWFDDLNEQVKQDLVEDESTKATPAVPQSLSATTSVTSTIKDAGESPSSFSITQALKNEEETKPKFLYPCQIKPEATDVSCPSKTLLKTRSHISKNRANFLEKSNEVKDSSRTCINGSEESMQKYISKLLNTPKSAKQRKYTTSFAVSEPTSSCGAMLVDGSTSPVLRKSRKSKRKRAKCLLTSESSQSTPKCDVKSTAPCTGNQVTPKSVIHDKSTAQKRPFTPQADEFNPWKKKPNLKPVARTLSGSFNKVSGASSVTPNSVKQKGCSVRNVTKSSPVISTVKPVEIVAISCDKRRQSYSVKSTVVYDGNNGNVESNCVSKITDSSSLALNKDDITKVDTSGNKNESQYDAPGIGNSSCNKICQSNSNLKDTTSFPCMNLAKSGSTLPKVLESKTYRTNDPNVEQGAVNNLPCVGFQTASMKPLKVSATSWEKAANFIASVDSSDIGKSHKPTTALKGVTVPKDAWNRACKVIKKQPSLDCSKADQTAFNCQKPNVENTSLEVTSKSCIVSATSSELNNSTRKQVNTSSMGNFGVPNSEGAQTTGFISASKKPLTVSSEALAKAESIINDADKFGFTNSTGFSTAGNKPLSISKQSWAKIQHIFHDEPKLQTDTPKPTMVSSASAKAQNQNNLNHFKSGNAGSKTVADKITACAVLTPTAKILNAKPEISSERKPATLFNSCMKAKRRNSSYKPPRRKICPTESSTLKPHSLADGGANNKENMQQNVESNTHSAKRKLGMKPTYEDQINVSDESLLMAMELFENV
uniref:Uncharacterized protein LOC100185089 n=1 Tax=Phallusia mammillata TaxID=59560 RepID=A0A6F9DHL8_9ASCI|nr:uncharacterized protein LOC100185089 [Phallusia mammillata]